MKTITELAPKEKVRTALYLDGTIYDKLTAFAEENGVSVNRASVYLLQLGLEQVEEA